MGDRLKGKAAIVTGGTSGIGKKTVEIFAKEGASVLIAARREKEGRELADTLGDKVDFIKTDVSREDDVQKMIDFAVERFGKLDCLFNNAGCPAPVGSIETIPLKDYEAAISVLLGGVMLGMKHAAPVMRNQGYGSIINNGSVAGMLAGYSSSIIYSAAKAAVIHLTKVVAMELGEKNVRVNCISPGGIATGIFAKALGKSTEDAEKSAEAVKQSLAGMQPVPRAGLPEDIALAAVFLASDESTFVNGHNLVVDGGLIGGRFWSAQQEGLDKMREAFGLSARLKK
ncbi:MAG: glucose 1-dehydrogenase [Proteobacteria bacterium]|nr:glucose 1-dehydrogenase [Pseudomonadota bacterium]MBU1389648.1 glucose 1-dehydrogenase [Pseudomonadota bacterium]MBU1542586.1 glucose 1-dehydrogenase [Pseudomonadota bacterium]MBU2483045.1 glucose 1-dehydrogenase [Pseudomonadota bacterium]